MAKTIVLGASPDPLRFSNKAVKSLIRHNHEVIPLGNRTGRIAGKDIIIGQPDFEDIHTVALYLNPENQKEYYNYIVKLSPRRVIFNPGTINEELIELVKKNNIEPVLDCALIMLNNNKY